MYSTLSPEFTSIFVYYALRNEDNKRAMRVSNLPLFGEKMSGAERVVFLMKCAASYFVFMIWRSVSCKNHKRSWLGITTRFF